MAGKKKTNKPTQEEITKALKEISSAKAAEAGVVKKEEKPITMEEITKIGEEIDNALKDAFIPDNNEPVPQEWVPIFNVLTRMYEASEDNYKNVAYNKAKDCLVVTLDSNIYNEEKEVANVRVQVCCDALNYISCLDNVNKKLTITIRKKH